MLDLETINYFLEFFKEGSLLKASKKLNISQPSLSRSIKKLEDELGIELFDRTGNKLIPNDNAMYLKPYFENMLLLEKTIMATADNIRHTTCTIRIGLTAPGPLYILCDKIERKGHKYQIEYLPENEIINQLNLEVIDVGFINKPHNDKNIISSKFLVEKLSVSLPKTHFLAKMTDGVYFKDIDGQSFLLGNSTGIWESLVREKMPNSRFYIQDMEALQEIVSASSLPAFVTNVSKNFDDENRVYIPILDDEASLTFYMVALRKEEKEIRDCMGL